MHRTLLLVLLLAGLASAQTTPNLGLAIPSAGTLNWNTPLNANFNRLDTLLACYGTATVAGTVSVWNGTSWVCGTTGVPAGTRGQPSIYNNAGTSVVSSFLYLDASQFTGSDWVAKANACLTALGSTGGICDLRALAGVQTSTSGTTIALGASQGVQLGVGTYASTANPVFTLDAGSSIRGIAKTASTIAVSTSGATGLAIVSGTGHNNITLEKFTLNSPSGTGTGFDFTGMQRSTVNDIWITAFATGLNCNSQTVNSLYDDFTHVLISPSAGSTGVSLRGICNALQFQSLTVINGATHVVVGNSADAISPNQVSFTAFDSESATIVGFNLLKGGPSITIAASSRFEADVLAVSVAPACTNIYGFTLRDSYFSNSNTTNVSNVCNAVTIGQSGQAPNVSYTDGLAVGNPLNLVPSTQNYNGTNTLLGWQSFNSTTFPSGTSIARVTSPLVTGTLHASAVQVGDGAAAFSGLMTSNKINVDASVPYTFSFWASADTSITTFRPVLLLYDSAGSLLTTGTGTNVTYTSAGNPSTGSLGYNKTGYACNCFATGADQTVTTANTYQRYTIAVRLPATAFQAQFGLAVNNTHRLYVDEFSVAAGPSPAQAFLSNPIVPTQLQLAPAVFSALPACSASVEGSTRAITDSSTVVWGATITGSSTNHVLGYCNGSNWTVAGK